MSESTFDVKQHEELRRRTDTHEKMLAVWEERDRNRERGLENFIKECREEFRDFNSSLKTIVAMQEQQALGMADYGNRLTISVAEVKKQSDRIDELQSEMKTSIGLRNEYFVLREKFKEIEANDKLNTKAREAAETERETLKKAGEKNERNLRIIGIWAGFVTAALGFMSYLNWVHKP